MNVVEDIIVKTTPIPLKKPTTHAVIVAGSKSERTIAESA
jgi:hypothetical protein